MTTTEHLYFHIELWEQERVKARAQLAIEQAQPRDPRCPILPSQRRIANLEADLAFARSHLVIHDSP